MRPTIVSLATQIFWQSSLSQGLDNREFTSPQRGFPLHHSSSRHVNTNLIALEFPD